MKNKVSKKLVSIIRKFQKNGKKHVDKIVRFKDDKHDIVERVHNKGNKLVSEIIDLKHPKKGILRRFSKPRF